MADRPMLFSAPMVRGLFDGTKTQTRRTLNPQPNMLNGGLPLNDGRGSYSTDAGWRKYRPLVGDRIWVRETWTARMDHGWTIADARSRLFNQEILYAADNVESIDGWWPSIHMPREFSRLTLTVTEVRVQRLQDISEADAIAEGIVGAEHDDGRWIFPVPGADEYRETAAEAYAALWDHITGAWDANPWCCAITFDVIRRNIDEVPL